MVGRLQRATRLKIQEARLPWPTCDCLVVARSSTLPFAPHTEAVLDCLRFSWIVLNWNCLAPTYYHPLISLSPLFPPFLVSSPPPFSLGPEPLGIPMLRVHLALVGRLMSGVAALEVALPLLALVHLLVLVDGLQRHALTASHGGGVRVRRLLICSYPIITQYSARMTLC